MIFKIQDKFGEITFCLYPAPNYTNVQVNQVKDHTMMNCAADY